MSEQTVVSVEDIKKEMMLVIKHEMSIIEKDERGCGLSPHIISRISSILQKTGMLCFNCGFCNILFPNDFLWKIRGKPLCSNCRNFIIGDKTKVKYN